MQGGESGGMGRRWGYVDHCRLGKVGHGQEVKTYLSGLPWLLPLTAPALLGWQRPQRLGFLGANPGASFVPLPVPPYIHIGYRGIPALAKALGGRRAPFCLPLPPRYTGWCSAYPCHSKDSWGDQFWHPLLIITQSWCPVHPALVFNSI